MNIIDIAIVVIILLAGIIGAKTGVIKNAVSLIGIIVVFILAYIFKGVVGNLLCKYLPFFNFSGDWEGLVTINILVYQVIAFIAVFMILLFIYSAIMIISTAIQKIVNSTIILKIPSIIGGAIIGFVEGYIICFLLLIALMLPLKTAEISTQSTLANYILYETPVVSAYTYNITNSVTEVYNVGTRVVNKTISTNDANLRILDIMLKYKMIDVHTVEQLIVLDKLKTVENIDTVLYKY